MQDENTYGFNKTDAEGLVSLLSSSEIVIPERTPRGDGGIRLAYTTGGATARTGTTCGTGEATLQNISTAGAITSASETIDFQNWVGTAVGSNRYILVQECGPVWVVVAEDCP